MLKTNPIVKYRGLIFIPDYSPYKYQIYNMFCSCGEDEEEQQYLLT